MYIADPEKRKDIYASPLQATVEQLKGLPPAFIELLMLTNWLISIVTD